MSITINNQLNDVQEQADAFYALLLEEEQALIALDLDRLSDVRKKKFDYVKWLEGLLRNKQQLLNLNKEMVEKIKEKNRTLANLYKFSMSLIKNEDDGYGNRSVQAMPHLSLKA